MKNKILLEDLEDLSVEELLDFIKGKENLFKNVLINFIIGQTQIFWIDVDKQLPELNSQVLCLNEDMSIEKGSYLCDYWTGNKPGFLDEQDEQPGRIYPIKWIYISELIPKI